MNRTDWQTMAAARLAEADALLAAGLPDGAYYLAGYAAEFGLKACIMALVERTGVFFNDKKFSEKCMTHDVEALIDVAGLKADFEAALQSDPAFRRCWQVVEKWNERARYKRFSHSEATELLDALNDSANGVMQWVKKYW